MRKPVLFALIAVIVVLLGALGLLYQRYRQTTVSYTETKSAQQSAESRYSDAINSIAEIQDSLSAIAIGDSAVRLVSPDLQTERRLGGPQRDEALERIAVLKAGLVRTKERIQRLESDLHERGVRVKGLERMIAGLKRTVSEKEGQIAVLAGQVDSLQTEVTGLTTEVQQKSDTLRVRDQVLEERRRELGTVYYVIGTKRELTRSGVVEAVGGLLGLGRTLKPSGRYDERLFTPLDTDHERVIRTSAAKARVLSSQPVTSYRLLVVGDRVEVHITDPLEFRKVRHLVIVTG